MNMKILLVIVVLVTAVLHSSEAVQHDVGGTVGWQNVNNASFYSDWAANQNFTIGDTLFFRFTTGVHDVAIVTKDAYDNCNTTKPSSVLTTGPATVTLNSTGMHHYFCTFDSHCLGGQKLAINVVGSSSSTPAPGPGGPTPSSGGSSPSPPPPSSASSHTAATFGLIFISIVMTFLY